MIWIFLAATIFGVSLLIPMLLGALDSGDFDFDAGDVDVDMDLEGGVEADGLSADGADGLGVDNLLSSLVSFRSLVFFSAFFGSSGLVLTGFDYGAGTAVIPATGIGLAAAVANSVLFGLLRGSQANSQISDATLVGKPAKVVLPIEPGRRGRIRVDLSGQPHYVVARAYEDNQGHQFGVGDHVVVVQIQSGTALVASLAGLDIGEES
ncbi:MAG: hypothetical protein ACR2HR_01775, partial [Euzebya sp.]